MRRSIARGTLRALLALAAAWPWAVAEADTLRATEYAVTATGVWETMPRIGNDGYSDLVVFTRAEMLADGSLGKGDLFYQRLAGGANFGALIQVTVGAQDNQLNDVSGDYIVYTAYDSVSSMSGRIMVYQISTTIQHAVGNALVIQEPRICGNKVVWREGGGGATMVMIYDLAWLGTARDADILAGPIPPAYNVDIGERFVVWAEMTAAQYDLVAYEIATSSRLALTATPNTTELEPSTSGPWVVWQAQDKGVAASRIIARNIDTAEERVVADGGVYNYRPSIDGDLIAWESMLNGNLDVFVYRLSTGETFRVTTDPTHQYLNDVFGQSIAYVDQRTGTEDIYVSDLIFVNVAPTAYDFGSIVAFTQSSTCVNLKNDNFQKAYVTPSLAAGTTPRFLVDLPAPPDARGYPVAVGETFCIPVVFAPTEVIPAASTVLTVALAFELGMRTDVAEVALTGSAVAGYGRIQVEPNALPFGDVEVGATRSLIATVTNTSEHWSSPVAASLLGISSPAFSFGCLAPTTCTCSAGTCSFVVAPLATADLEVRFSPASTGSASGALAINTTDQTNQAALVSLTGTGVHVPTPTDQITDLIKFFDDSVADGSLVGSGNGNSAAGRLDALRNMIKAAGDLIARGQLATACQQLLDAYQRVDGLTRPPDFAAGSAAADLRALIGALRSSIGCT